MSPAETDFWKIANRLPGALLLVDLDGQLVAANKHGRTLLEVDGDMQGISLFAKSSSPDDALRRYLGICAGSYQPMPGRITIQRNNGEMVQYAVSGSRVDMDSLERAGGHIVLWAAEPSANSARARFTTLNTTIDQLTREIRSRRQAEALLEAEKRILEMIVNGKPLEAALEVLALVVEEHTDGMLMSILLLDKENRLRHAAAPNLSHRYIDAIDGVHIGPLVGSCGTAAWTKETVVAADIATDSRWNDFREIALQEGLQACWSTPILGSDGGVQGTLALYYRAQREPTESELRLIENSALIAGITIERYRTLENLSIMYQQEHEQRERAEAESRAKDHFLAILSHELRNPLSAAVNAAYALEEIDEHDHQRSELQSIIVNNTGMLKRILDDLLDLTRLNTGKLSLQMAPLNLSSMMSELVTSFQVSAPHRKLRYSCVQDDLWVDGDQARLQQTVHNLLGNAVKYSEDADEITVELSGDDQELCLSVRDSGRGIDASLLPEIFTPFVQSEESLGRVDSGLGLGLALVRQFAEMHGGSISAHSEGVGHGSEFKLRLPRGRAVQKSETEHRKKAEPARACKVMVVEDNAGARHGLCRLLERWGHSVSSAADGEEALAMMRDDRPEVALVDIGLPGISGYDIARTVRAEPALASIKLIALTGYGQEKDREMTAEVGFDRHLVKPVERADLLDIFGMPGKT
ncbi:MAG: response regulator [Granulosicoccus sp.]|nr:response regulator [Granulosicoccus sp.]